MISTGRVDHRHPAMFGVIVEYVENYGLWSARSTHGSAYRYDREVPLLLLGAGIEAGVSSLPARTVDVAPTLAYLAGVSFPESVDGQVLRFR
jgi:arylsulfatase A-like enzyme